MLLRYAALFVDAEALRGSIAETPVIIDGEFGEQLIEQRLLLVGGADLTMQVTVRGTLRTLLRSGVSTDENSLSRSALIAHGIRHLAALWITMPAGLPEVQDLGGREILFWERRVDGVRVPGDGLRVVLAASGELVGIAQPAPDPLAPAPAEGARATRAAALMAAAGRLPEGGNLDGTAELCVGNPTPLCMWNETSEWPPLPCWEWPVGETIMRRSTVHARRSCSRKWEHDPIAIRHCWIAQLKLHAEECG